MSALIDFPLETLFFRLAGPTRRQLAQQALQHDKSRVEELLRQANLYKGWANQGLPKKQEMLADFACTEATLSRRLLQGWLGRNTPLKNRVWEDLVAAGYHPVLPAWSAKPGALSFQVLRDEDVLTSADHRYFAPAGTGVTDVSPESYTLMAHLLGWSVLNEEVVEDAAAVGTAPAAAPTAAEPAAEVPEQLSAPATLNAPAVAAVPELSIAAWQATTAELEEAMHRLAAAYEDAARCLWQGQWPTQVLEQQLAELQLTAAQLGNQLRLPMDAELPDLAQLRAGIAQAEERQRHTAQAARQRRAALAVLAMVGQVQYKQGPEFTPLQALHQQAAALAVSIAAAPAATPVADESALAAGTHPLARFLELVRQVSLLDDEAPETQQADEFMRELGGPVLARAWVRGHLLPPAAADPAASAAPEPTPLPPRVAPVATSIPLANSLSLTEIIATSGPQSASGFTSSVITQEAEPAALPTELVEMADTLVDTPVVADEAAAAPTESRAVLAEAATETAVAKEIEEPAAAPLPTAAIADAPPVSILEFPTAGPLDQPAPATIGRRQWALLAAGEASLAFQLARCAEELGWDTTEMLPAWLLHSLLLGPQVQTAYGRLATLLADDSQQFSQAQLAAVGEEPDGTRHLLAWAAALRPALLAPATALGGWLSIGGVTGLPVLSELVKQLAGRHSAAPLDEALLAAMQTQQQWAEHLHEWQAGLDEWARQQELAKFRQSLTNDIVLFWKSLRQPGRLVAQVLAGLKAAAPDHDGLLDKLATLRDRSGLRDELKRSKISFSVHIQQNTDAQRWLDERVAALADLVRQHRELWQRRPAGAGKDTHHDDHLLLAELGRQLPLVAQELHEAAQPPAPGQPALPWQVALGLMQQTVAQLQSWLAHPAAGRHETLPRYWLGQALLRVPGLELTADWEPLTYDITLWAQLWQLAGQGPPDWPALYAAAEHETAEARGADHLATARLLALAEAATDPTQGLAVQLGTELAPLRAARAASLERQRRQLGRTLDGVERELVRGRCAGAASRSGAEKAR